MAAEQRVSPPERVPVAGRAAAVAAVVLSGWLYARCFPVASDRWLAWVALVPFLVAVRTGSAARALGLGFVVMLVLAYGVNDWFPRAVATYYLQPAWVGFAFFLGVTALTAAPATMIFALWYRRTPGPAVLLPVTAAAAWVAGELLRTRLLGDPWVLFGYSQVGVDALVQVADLGGVYAVSFVLVAVNVAVAQMATCLATERGRWRTALGGVGVAAAIVAATLGYGARRIDAVTRSPVEPPHTVAVVQANLDLGSQWRDEFYGRNLDRYLTMTRDVVARTPVDLVVWPESANTFFLDEEPLYRLAIGRVLAPRDVQLVTGGPRRAVPDAARFHNSAFLLASGGDVLARYDKRLLLPFAEYFPLRGLDLVRRRFGRVREFTPGWRTPPLETAVGRVGVTICNEALFAAPVIDRVRSGATMLLVLANDSWVGEPKFAAQAFDMAVLRAVEQRRYLVRASTAGPSAIVEPTGRLQARSAFATADTLVGRVAPRTDRTPYARTGDLFAGLCTLLAALAGLRRRPGGA